MIPALWWPWGPTVGPPTPASSKPKTHLDSNTSGQSFSLLGARDRGCRDQYTEWSRCGDGVVETRSSGRRSLSPGSDLNPGAASSSEGDHSCSLGETKSRSYGSGDCIGGRAQSFKVRVNVALGD